MNKNHNIAIREAYKDYEPPFDVVRIIDRLIGGLPARRLAGLKTVVATSSGNLSKNVRNARRRSRGRTYELGTCLGRYHPRSKHQAAWIELWVDNMLRGWPKSCLAFSFFRDFAISDTLFHEIGHHIHHTQAPEHKEKEDVADKWDRKLSQHYFKRHYWYLMPLLFVPWLIIKAVRRRRKLRETIGIGTPLAGIGVKLRM